jgi:hypothetical protein
MPIQTKGGFIRRFCCPAVCGFFIFNKPKGRIMPNYSWEGATWNERGELILDIYANPPEGNKTKGRGRPSPQEHTYSEIDCGGECGACIALVVDGPPFHKNCNCGAVSGDDIDNAEVHDSMLRDSVGPKRNVNLDDAAWVKESLHELGFYHPDARAGETADSISEYPNQNMFDAIDRFQQAYNLNENGVVKPGHRTEARMQQALNEHQEMKADKAFNKSMNTLFRAEGGYNNLKADRGGETNLGISKNTFPREDIPNMTHDRAAHIYYNEFWNKNGVNELPGALRYAVFDGAVNHGGGKAVKMLQETLGITHDGDIGSNTLDAINNYDGDIFGDYLERRRALYEYQSKNVPNQDIFRDGWNNRLDGLYELRDAGKI